jgi:hypothetical protein
MHRGIHVARAFHIDARDARPGVCSCTGPVTMVTCAPASLGRRGNGKAHFSRAAIGEITHRIEALAGRVPP